MYLTFRHAENPPEASASVSPFFLYASIAVQFSNTSKSPPSMPSRFGLSSVGVLEECPQPERNMGGPIAHQDSLLDLMNQTDLIWISLSTLSKVSQAFQITGQQKNGIL